MKKLVVLFLTGVLAVSLIASAAFAGSRNNEIGIYTDPSGDEATTSIVAAPFVGFEAYLVLLNPYDDAAGAPLTGILGFECSITLPPSLLKQVETLAPTGVNLGAGTDYYVGFTASPMMTGPDNAMVLDTFTFLPLNADPMMIFLGMASAPSIAGTMSIADEADLGNLISIFPVSGDLANPVFGVNTAVVASEEVSFGSVKGLFR